MGIRYRCNRKREENKKKKDEGKKYEMSMGNWKMVL